MIDKKNKVTRQTLLSVAVASALCTVGSASFAGELNANFSAAVGQSDNILRTSGNVPEVDETMGVIGAQLSYEEETRKLTASIDANFDYINYFEDAFDNEVVGGLVGLLNIRLIEEKLAWDTSYNYGQQVFDPPSTLNTGQS